jgi:5-formyltetrahydrofolate cyclo-ligase
MPSQKSALRRQMREILKTRLDECTLRSKRVCEHLVVESDWISARTVALFCPMLGEVDLLGLLPIDGKRAIFPAVAGARLEWREARSVSEFVASASFANLREPSVSESVELCEADLVVVPGLAFTLGGKRLGRGGGFYDRALEKLPSAVKRIGVCFEFQVLEDLPTESHDALLDIVVAG